MEKQTRVFLTFLFVILLVAVLYIFTDWFSQATGYFTGESETKNIALCLSKRGAEFYGTIYCVDCEKTKKMFGQSFKLINEFDCGAEKENCPNIHSIPAWFIDNKIYYGFKNLTELQEISNCKS